MERRFQSHSIKLFDSVRTKSLINCFVSLALLCLTCAQSLLAQSPITFRYFYDDLGQLKKVVDSTGVSIEYVYDPVGNILEVKRSTAPAGQLTIFSFTPVQGGALSTVTIQGQGFNTQASANVIRFNGVTASVLS